MSGTVMSFDELLDSMAKAGEVVGVPIKALGGRKVFFRQPSSLEADQWRVYCGDKSQGPRPISAKLVQLLLCDESGRSIVPQTDDALEEMASRQPQVVDEIAKHIFPFVREPSDADLEAVAGN